MDNITHSLVGVTLAEAAIQGTDPKGSRLNGMSRPFIYIVSLLANNLPDIDPFYTFITGGKLGYLVHHRGYTHTFLGIFIEVWVILGLILIWARLRKKTFTRKQWMTLGGLSLFGLCTHIFMDSWNPYGVHPFSPFNNTWFYGDAISVLEPLFWLTLVPLFFLGTTKKRWKGFLGFVFIAGLYINGFFSEIPAVTVPLLGVIGLIFFWVHHIARTHFRRVMISVASLLVIVGGYYFISFNVRNDLGAMLKRENSGYTVSDLILFPMPGNPICWNFIAVESSSTDYRMRNGVKSIFPGVIPPRNCRVLDPADMTAEMKTLMKEDPNGVLWFGEYVAPIYELAELNQGHCYVRAAMRFLRAPYWKFQDEKILVGDLRFDFSAGLGFSEMLFVKQVRNCPKYVSQWTPPRSDVLDVGRVIALQRKANQDSIERRPSSVPQQKADPD